VLKDEKTDMSWEMAISFIQATVRGIHLLHTSQPQVLHRCGRSHVTPIKADIYFPCKRIFIHSVLSDSREYRAGT
jgi:hypothetical protein